MQITPMTYGIDTDQPELRAGLLQFATSANISTLDMRSSLEADGYTTKDVFYKTDHHWNTRAGLYAAGQMAAFLNTAFPLALQEDLLSPDCFTMTDFPNLWFGETGRSVSLSYTGALDDFTLITPNYETDFTITGSENFTLSGDFSVMVDDTGYTTPSIDYYSYSAHYSYLPQMKAPLHIHNNKMQNGAKILLIKDSFSVVVAPFLSLAVSDLTLWDVRETSESLLDYIREQDFDVVLLAYTDFWRDDMWSFH